jgi:hypothetical protein
MHFISLKSVQSAVRKKEKPTRVLADFLAIENLGEDCRVLEVKKKQERGD